MKEGLKLTSGQKAWETRKRNAALGIYPCKATIYSLKSKPGRQPTGLKRQKITFKKLNEENYHKLSISSPVTVYIHKTLSRMYISPVLTEIVKCE